jgi:hypothetical protein
VDDAEVNGVGRVEPDRYADGVGFDHTSSVVAGPGGALVAVADRSRRIREPTAAADPD